MATINLAPGTQYIVIARRRRRILFTVSGVIAVGLVAVWAVLFVLISSETKKNQDTQSQLAVVETEIASVGSDTDRVALFETRLKAIDALFKQRVSMVSILKELEKLLPPTTVITKATITVDGNHLDITGNTAALDDVAQAVASLGNNPDRSKIFKHAAIGTITQKITKADNGTPETGVYMFQLSIDLDTSSLQGAVQ